MSKMNLKLLSIVGSFADGFIMRRLTGLSGCRSVDVYAPRKSRPSPRLLQSLRVTGCLQAIAGCYIGLMLSER